MDIILECKSLNFSHGPVKILDQVSFTVGRGRFCGVLGRNGSGKTTLLHCLNGINPPPPHAVFLSGKDITRMSQRQIARHISLVPQEHMDMFPFKVIDVVVMGRAPFLSLAALPGKGDYKRAEEALAALNAQDLADKNFNRISGGERRIALLARAMTQTTEIMLLDEPTNHLDFNNQYHLLAAIKDQCNQRGVSIIASMHDPNMAALFADDIVMVKRGRIMDQGPADKIMTPQNISRLYDTPVEQTRAPGYPKPLFFPEYTLEKNMGGKNIEKNNMGSPSLEKEVAHGH